MLLKCVTTDLCAGADTLLASNQHTGLRAALKPATHDLCTRVVQNFVKFDAFYDLLKCKGWT